MGPKSVIWVSESNPPVTHSSSRRNQRDSQRFKRGTVRGTWTPKTGRDAKPLVKERENWKGCGRVPPVKVKRGEGVYLYHFESLRFTE